MSEPLTTIRFRIGKRADFKREINDWSALPAVPEHEKIVYKPDEWDTKDLECGIDFVGPFTDAPEPLSSYQREEKARLARLQSLRRTAASTLVYYSITDLYKMKNAYIDLVGHIFNKYMGDKWINDELLTPFARDISRVFIDVLQIIPYRMKEHNPE